MANTGFEACKANIEGVLGREMTPEEKRAIRNRAPEVMKKIANTTDGSPGAIARVLQNFKDEADGRKAWNIRTNAGDYIHTSELLDRLRKGHAEIKHAGEAMIAITKGSLWNFIGSNDSVTNLIDREVANRRMAFRADLAEAGLWDIAYSAQLDEKITGAQEQIRKGLPVDPKWGPQAIKIAQIFEKHTEKGRMDSNANGSWIPKNDDRLMAMRYDHNRVASGDGNHAYGSKEASKFFVDEWMKRMDWDKAFSGDFVKASDAQRRERLGDIWQQFKEDAHFRSNPTFYGPGKTYGLQPHIEMVTKTPAQRYEMFKMFGRGSSLAEAHDTELGRIGQNVAVLKTLGVHADKNLSSAVHTYYNELMSKGGTFEERLESKRQAGLLMEAYQDEVKNTMRLINDTIAHPKDNAVGRFMSSVRQTVNTTATALSLPTLMGDLNLKAVRMATQGRGSWLGNLGDAAVMQFTPKGLTPGEQARFYSGAGIMLEINRKPTDFGGLSEHKIYDAVNKANGMFRSVSGHSTWDNSARLGSMIRDYNYYHDIKGTEWGDLNGDQQTTLNSFGINRIGWDVMRQTPSVDLPSGWGKGLRPEEILEMPLDKFKSLSPHQNPSSVTLKRMRDRLADQYRDLLGENANRTVSAPSTTRLARMRVGKYYDPNTPHGWVMSQAASLKGWAINYLTEHLGRGILSQYTEHASMGKIFSDLMTGQNMNGIKITGQYMVGGMAIAYVSNYIRQLAMGKTPVDPTKIIPGKDFMDQPAVQAATEAFAKGSAGTFGDFIFSQSAPGSQHPLEDKARRLVLGPEAEFYLAVGDTLLKSGSDAIKHGGFSGAAIRKDEQKAFGVGYHALPPSNMIISKWALEHWFFNPLSEKITPGYQQRLKDYARKQNTGYIGGSP